MESSNNKMIIHRLGESVKTPFYLLKYNYVNILLDCPLDLSVLSNFMPQHPLLIEGASNLSPLQKQDIDDYNHLCKVQGQTYFDTEFKLGFLSKSKINKINLETVDAVLVSNSSSMLGLPYLIRNPKFRAKIYATEPTVQFGRIMMMEILNAINGLPCNINKLNVSSNEFQDLGETLPFSISDFLIDWYDIYTEKSIKECLTRIKHISFDEPFNLYGLLTVRGVCSGYAIGSCNWVISSKYEKVSYISHSSGIVSHSAPLDVSQFKDIDVTIIGSAIPDYFLPIEKLCDEMCGKICDTIKAGGNVLLPVSCCGLFLDLVEKIYAELVQRRLDSTKMFILSSQAKSSLAYANIYGEWLNRQRESQLYTADYPFIFDKLIKSNILIPCDEISGEFSRKFRSPSVVFVSHPSLRIGPVVHLLRLWGTNPLNALFLIDTDNYDLPQKKELQLQTMERVLGPYFPLAMAVHYFPMETRIKIIELPALIEQMSMPKQYLVLPSECAVLNQSLASKMLDKSKILELHPDKPIEINVSNLRYDAINESYGGGDNKSADDDEEEVMINSALANQLRPIVVDDETSICLFQSRLIYRDGGYELCSPNKMTNLNTNLVGGYNKNNSGANNTINITTGSDADMANLTGDEEPTEVANNMSNDATHPQFLFGFSLLDVKRFVDELKSRGLTDAKLETLEEGRGYLVCFSDESSIIQLSDNWTHVVCNNESTRKRIQESLISCLSVLTL